MEKKKLYNAGLSSPIKIQMHPLTEEISSTNFAISQLS